MKTLFKIFQIGAVTAISIASITSSSLPSLAQAQEVKSQQPMLIAQAKSRLGQRMQELKNSNQRWIQVDLSEQRLTAWEGDRRVYSVIVSSGKSGTPTLTGSYNIQTKLRSTTMRGQGYSVPNVPYTMFYSGGYAIHGAYWHNSFGTPVSHGCINLPVSKARMIFKWSQVGTPIVIHR